MRKRFERPKMGRNWREMQRKSKSKHQTQKPMSFHISKADYQRVTLGSQTEPDCKPKNFTFALKIRKLNQQNGVGQKIELRNSEAKFAMNFR